VTAAAAGGAEPSDSTGARPPERPGPTPAPVYDEPLRVPLWAWPAALAVALLLAAAVHGGYGGLRSWVPYVAAPVLVALVLGRASRGRVVVADGVLRVPGARIPVRFLGAARPLDAEQTRRLRGPAADLRAHVATRAWLRRGVQVRVEDPDDDTPYWLIGTRRPAELAAALDAAREPGRDPERA
jgi:hypothetical protein